MIAQYVAAALVSECRARSHFASVDSVATSGLQEDYNSMGAGAALKARDVLDRARQVLAIELPVAGQALHCRAPLVPGAGSHATLAAVRRRIPPLAEDRYLKGDLDAAFELCGDGSVLEAVEGAVGPLA